MGLVSAIKKIREVLIVDGLPELIVGINASFQSSPFPFFYMDVGEITSEYGALVANYETTTLSHTTLVFGVHIDNLPAGHEWALWPIEVAESIKEKIMLETRNRTWEQDGSMGFEAKIVSSKIEFDQTDAMAMCAMVLEIGAYQ